MLHGVVVEHGVQLNIDGRVAKGEHFMNELQLVQLGCQLPAVALHVTDLITVR